MATKERDVSSYAKKMKLSDGEDTSDGSHPPITSKHMIELMRDGVTVWNGKKLPHEVKDGEDEYHAAVGAFRDCYEGEGGDDEDSEQAAE